MKYLVLVNMINAVFSKATIDSLSSTSGTVTLKAFIFINS